MKRLLAVVALGMSVAVAGCGSSTTTTVTVGRSSTSTTAPSTSTSSTSTIAAGRTTAPTAHPPTVHLATFKSPSGNIGCTIIAGTARCDIRQRSWSPPPRPASCPSEVDFGQGLIVGRHGSAKLVCAGDTAMDPGAAVLRYGFDTSAGGFRCQSRTSGVTCRNAGGRGFFISIQSYRTF